MKFLYLFLSLFFGASLAFGEKPEFDFETQVRQFEDDDNEDTFEDQQTLTINARFEHETDKEKYDLDIMGRYDGQDSNRRRAWIKDLYYQKFTTNYGSWLIGFKEHNLSYLEAFNPLDVMNARIFDLNIYENQKIGELSLGFSMEKDWGILTFYILPKPERPILPGEDSRFDLPQNLNEAKWLGTSGEEDDWDDHFYLLYEKNLENADLSFLFHKGVDRTYFLIGSNDYTIISGMAIPNSMDLFTPYFYERYLSGANLVYNFESFQFKTTIANSYYLSNTEIFTLTDVKKPVDHTTIAIGIEKQFDHDSGYTSTLYIEGQSQEFSDDIEEGDYPLQSDLFLGLRLSFNDTKAKELLMTMVIDYEGAKDRIYHIRYNQRVFTAQKIEIGHLNYEIDKDAPVSGFGLLQKAKHTYLKYIFYY